MKNKKMLWAKPMHVFALESLSKKSAIHWQINAPSSTPPVIIMLRIIK